MKKIFLFSENKDIKKIVASLKDATLIDLNMNYVKSIKKLLESNNNKKNIIITENSLKGLYTALIFKLIRKNDYFVWFESCKEENDTLIKTVPLYFSKAFITRTKQIRATINKKYQKRTFVIFPWIEEKKHSPEKFSYKIYSNFNIELPSKWQYSSLETSNVAVLKFKDNLLNYELPEIILKSIEQRIPTIIIYHKPKTVNKIFKYVKNIYPLKDIKNLNFYDLEYYANQSYKFKIPKKLRFKYNLAKLKGYLK